MLYPCLRALALSALLAGSLAAPKGAQADPGPRWTVQVDPLTAALGYPHLLFERAVSERLSVYAGPHLRLYDPVFAEAEEDYLGLGVEAGARWFFWGRAPEGTWIGLRGVGAWVSAPDGAANSGGYLSLLAGHTWIFAERWVVAMALGGQVIDYGVSGMGVRGVFPAAHTAVGVAF